MSNILQEVLGAPECMSFVFNEDGKVASFTGGYIMDRSAAASLKMHSNESVQTHHTSSLAYACSELDSSCAC